MKRICLTLFIVLLISISLIGCGQADMEGIALDVHENGITLATDLTLVEYEEIKNKSATKIQNEDVAGERASLGLVDLTYKKTDKLSKGDEVKVWIDGDIMSSYPGQADARKIKIKQ